MMMFKKPLLSHKQAEQLKSILAEWDAADVLMDKDHMYTGEVFYSKTDVSSTLWYGSLDDEVRIRNYQGSYEFIFAEKASIDLAITAFKVKLRELTA